MADLLPPGFVFHQSNLQAFQSCRYSFLLRYIQKLPWPAPLSARTNTFEQDLLAGSTLHSLIHQFFLGINPELLISVASNFPDSRVSVWLDNFLKSQYATLTPHSLPEHTLRITLNGSLLLAKFDLIRVKDDLIQIYDWKTSRKLPKRQFLQDRIQTMVYPLVATRALSLPTRTIAMHYWEAAFPYQPIIFDITDSHIKKYEEVISKQITLIRSLAAEEFDRTTDTNKCSYCEYQSYCSRSGSIADEESFRDWLEIGFSELQVDESDRQVKV